MSKSNPAASTANCSQIPPVLRCWWLPSVPVEDTSRRLDIGRVGLRCEKLGCLHRRDFLRHGRHHELVHARAIFLADLREGSLQRCRQPQRHRKQDREVTVQNTADQFGRCTSRATQCSDYDVGVKYEAHADSSPTPLLAPTAPPPDSSRSPPRSLVRGRTVPAHSAPHALHPRRSGRWQG